MVENPVVRLLLLWVVLSALCAGLNESTDTAEWVLAVGCGGLAAGVGTVAVRVFGVRPGLPHRPAALALVPLDVARDTWRLLLDLPRLRRPGSRSTRTAPARSEAEAAWAVLVASASPGAYVVDADERRRGVELTLHSRTAPGPALTRALARDRRSGRGKRR